MANERYNHQEIEKRAQEKWEALKLYETDLADTQRDPYYLLFEFPYPSGDLHIGHWYAFALTDIYARKLRMEGKNVLFPVGFDAFGLPAENAAIKNGLDPRDWTYKNMETMRAQMKSMGTAMDWSKEVITCEPEYYRWTQWLFSKLYEHGLAERKNAAVKWCPKDQTVLANEQVIDGHCERCGTEVEDKSLTQWFFKITQYAERLLKDLDPLPWREEIKDAQRAWIGESEGARLTFPVRAGEEELPVDIFTTRPDTLYGATYLVLAPEHPLLEKLLEYATNADEVRTYQRETGRKTERERSENKEKTGVVLSGITATNPATKESIPVYIADYVLASYGTGAVMAVPAHDERDFEFAHKYEIPIINVIAPKFVDDRNPPRDDAETVPRKIVIALVHDPKTDKYLALEWNKDERAFVTGGIEGGESPIEAGAREVAEETGYTDIAYTRTLGGPTEAHFYAGHKGVNRITETTLLLFELTSEARQEISAEEAEHPAVWVSRSELTRERFAHAEMNTILDRLDGNDGPYLGDGSLVYSGNFTGRNNREAMSEIVEAAGGELVKNYRIRDWLVSRQRYWGCPIPVVYDPEGAAHLVPPEHLPWLLPEDVDLTPGAAGAGKSPLATSKELHERVTRIFGEGWTPEYDTLDTFVDSSWYYLRYLAPHDAHDFSDASLMKRWMPVNRYSGGSEHTTLHLLYARFFNKALYDLALAPSSEPFNERFNRGLILGPDGQKMSKSKGNVINPDEFVAKYGADAVRMYLAFIGPYDEPGSYPWNLDGVEAMRRFLDRVAALPERLSDSAMTPALQKSIARASVKVGGDITRFKFNTAISALMILLKEFEALPSVPRAAYGELLALLAPFAPHLSEHLFEELGSHQRADGTTVESVHQLPWLVVDEALLVEDQATVIVQIAGKKRGELLISPELSQEDAVQMALALPEVSKYLPEGKPGRVIYVKGRILNLVP